MSLAQVRWALHRAGRQRDLDSRAAEIRSGLRTSQRHAPAPVAEPFDAVVRSKVAIIVELNDRSSRSRPLADRFEQHPDVDAYLSLPGLGDVFGARLLGEFGKVPNRYADAECRKNYADRSSRTIASGEKRAVLARHVRNRRLYAIDMWAFCSRSTSPGCRGFYDQRRAAGDLRHRTLRTLRNPLVGILHGCLRTHTPTTNTPPGPTATHSPWTWARQLPPGMSNRFVGAPTAR